MSTIRVVNVQHTDATVPNIVLESDGTAVFASGITISGGTNLTISGTAEFASGTAAAPKITFIDDNNTGIYEPAVDTVAITTAATERLRVDSSGRVLIGDTSVFANANADDLQIGTTSTTDVGLTVGSSTQGQIAFADSGDSRAGLIHYQHTDNSMRFYTAGPANERLRIDSSGRVLIGTTTNTYNNAKVQIAGPNSNNYLSILNTTDADGEGAGYSILHFRRRQSGGEESSSANISGRHDGTADDQKGVLTFGTNDGNDANSPTERMRIDSSGRLLVGTTSFAGVGGGAKLQVIQNDTADLRTITMGSTSVDQKLHLGAFSSGTSYITWGGYYDNGWTTDDTANTFCIGAIQLTALSTGSDIVFRTSNSANTSPADRIRIKSNGALALLSGCPGIDFSGIQTNAPGMTSEILDSYEEGTWTPTTNTGTISYNKAIYTKIGRQVTLYAECTTFSNRTDTDRVEINGLPFTAINSGSAVGSAMWRYVDAQAHTVYLEGDGLYFYQSTSGNWESLNYNELNASNSGVYFVATYMT